MQKKFFKSFVFAIFILYIVVIATWGEEITVITIHDLQGPMEEIKKEFEHKYPRDYINYIYQTKSSILETITNNQSSADILLIDDIKTVKKLARTKIIKEDSIQIIGKDELCVVVENYKPLRAFFLYPQTRIFKGIITGSPYQNALGEYTKEALNYFGLTKKIPEKILYRDNNKHIANLVARGNYDGGIMYCSYAKRTKLRITDQLNPKIHSPIKYTSGLINKSNKMQVAETFNQFLSSAQAKKILKKYYIAF